jgi:hypothetical protein
MLDVRLLIALLAAVVNYVFSLIIPPLLQNSNVPFAKEVSKNYTNNKDIMLVSSIIVVIFVYISLIIQPWVPQDILNTLAKLS